jgi:fumarylpyruvate hydrolase
MSPHYAFEPPPRPALTILGRDTRFPVRRVWCVGRNYAAHAREMGSDPDREPPFFFAKPADAAVDVTARDAVVSYPPQTGDLHHEVELVVGLGAGGAGLDASTALDCVYGYGVGVDLTRRDLQAAAKAARRPWALAKGFDAAAPCGALTPVADIGHPRAGAITLSVDGDLRQSGDLNQMIWDVGETLAALSASVTLAAGDLVLTGTPSGVGPLEPGALVEGSIEGVGSIRFRIGDPVRAPDPA